MKRRDFILAALACTVPRAARAGVSLDADARWLAGIAPLPGIDPSDEWRAYAAREDERWRATTARAQTMRTWATRDLAPLLPLGRALFYPFAGPDALHAIALFPSSPRVVMVGLEPVGELPPSGRAPASYFTRLGDALADLHRLTFFRTHAMASDFQRDGVIGALLVTIARLGGRVVDVRFADAPSSVRIDWTTAAGDAKGLDYVRVDLANAGLAKEASWLAQLETLGPFVSFLKAASYLLWEDRFSHLRRVLFEESNAIVQDDTGLPFRAFDRRWSMRFFGHYSAPESPFQDRAQPDLERAFAARAPAPLPFAIGYRADARASHLLVASRGA